MIYQRIQERSKQNEGRRSFDVPSVTLSNNSPKTSPEDQSGEGR